MAIRVLSAIGTRPEAIKMAPIVRLLAERGAAFHSIVCVTAQHRAMLDQVLRTFDIAPDIDLDLMEERQGLADLSARVVVAMTGVIEKTAPDVVLVQGDTTTTMATALAAFYLKIPVGHVEAGLRTGDRYAPFPEEMNRRVIATLATLHFAPTERAAAALRAEQVEADGIFVTGNPVVDALHLVAARPPDADTAALLDTLRRAAETQGRRRVVLVTAHRRESLGQGLENICAAIRTLLERHADLQIVFPVHLNPEVRRAVFSRLGHLPGATLVAPVSYETLVHLLKACDLVLTDSGGIQEEAPTFGKPVLVLRDVTERPEGVEAGVARIVGTSTARIVAECSELLGNPAAYRRMARALDLYGDGRSAARILDILERT